jgi:hypothetical protein
MSTLAGKEDGAENTPVVSVRPGYSVLYVNGR